MQGGLSASCCIPRGMRSIAAAPCPHCALPLLQPPAVKLGMEGHGAGMEGRVPQPPASLLTPLDPPPRCAATSCGP